MSQRSGQTSPGKTSGDSLAREIIDSTPDAVIYADAAGVIQLWNPGATAMFGYSAEEAIGQTLDLIVPERLRGRHWEGYHRVMKTGESHYGPGELLAVPAVQKDGTRISLEFSIAMLRDDAGRIEGIVAILRNVTARREQEKELRQRLEALVPAQPGSSAA